MVQVKINGSQYNVCSSWKEVDKVKLLKCENPRQELVALSNIPEELIKKASDKQLFPLFTLISFIHDIEIIPAIQALDIPVKSCYNSFEKAKKILSSDKPMYNRLIATASIYYPQEKDLVRLIGLGRSIDSQIALFLGVYLEMFEEKPTDNQINAGIDTLADFSHWGVAFTMAGRDLERMNRILYNTPVIEVYTALHYSWREAKYNKRLWEIEHPPPKK
jgi:hypothetical protein